MLVALHDAFPSLSSDASFGREHETPDAIGLVDELLHIRNAFPALRLATEATEQLTDGTGTGTAASARALRDFLAHRPFTQAIAIADIHRPTVPWRGATRFVASGS
ncbi:hypothetical protein [Hypericibacter terrae]|nr:hypothetical protein [Hypericibacter terrae]